MTYIPPPATLAAFPRAVPAKRKTRVSGGGLLKRWKDDEFIYEWDTLHGKVEKYSKKGKHLGEFDPDTGKQTKQADSSRSIEP
ncbi:MAG: colicin E3 [Symploca sp. SIO2C1]|nr:colicin E3 [Symploca sp. SIO2C1]